MIVGIVLPVNKLNMRVMRIKKQVPKPKAVKTSVVKFCKANKISVREFVNDRVAQIMHAKTIV